MHHVGDIMLNRFTDAKKLGLFRRSGHDTIGIDPGTQNSQLRLQQLKLRVVPGAKLFCCEGNEREHQLIHRHPFRSFWLDNRPDNEAYRGVATFMNPLVPGANPYTVKCTVENGKHGTQNAMELSPHNIAKLQGINGF